MSTQQSSATPLPFRIGMFGAFIAPIVFIVSTVSFFVVFRAFDMNGLTMSAVVGLLIAAPFARNYQAFWNAVFRGVASQTSVMLLVLLLTVGLVSQLLKNTGLSEGFVWLALSIGVHGATFIAIAFVAVCAIAMATGSSLGTMFTVFPIFYPAGVILGADPVLLAGALLSGALFGDNVAPISDSTIVSAATQKYRTRRGNAEIPGVIASRMRYSLPAAAITLALFWGIGAAVSPGSAAVAELSASDFSAQGLWMILAVVALLTTAFVTRDLFKAISVGLVVGVIVGLISGVLAPTGIVGVDGDALSGFLVEGVAGMLPIVGLSLSVFAMLGVLEGAGVLDRLTAAVISSGWVRTPRRAELAIGAGTLVTITLFASVNGPSMMVFGPIADRLGSRTGLHPYRRSNVMDCFALGIGSIVPVASSFLFIGSLLTADLPDAPALSPMGLFVGTFYPMVLTVVMLVSIVTGWGRRFEGQDGASVTAHADAVIVDESAGSAEPGDRDAAPAGGPASATDERP